jgi:hypothetical protein
MISQKFNFKKPAVSCPYPNLASTFDILRISQLLPFYRYESDISSFLEDDTVLSDMEVFDFEDSCFSSILESP